MNLSPKAAHLSRSMKPWLKAVFEAARPPPSSWICTTPGGGAAPPCSAAQVYCCLRIVSNTLAAGLVAHAKQVVA